MASTDVLANLARMSSIGDGEEWSRAQAIVDDDDDDYDDDDLMGNMSSEDEDEKAEEGVSDDGGDAPVAAASACSACLVVGALKIQDVQGGYALCCPCESFRDIRLPWFSHRDFVQWTALGSNLQIVKDTSATKSEIMEQPRPKDERVEEFDRTYLRIEGATEKFVRVEDLTNPLPKDQLETIQYCGATYYGVRGGGVPRELSITPVTEKGFQHVLAVSSERAQLTEDQHGDVYRNCVLRDIGSRPPPAYGGDALRALMGIQSGAFHGSLPSMSAPHVGCGVRPATTSRTMPSSLMPPPPLPTTPSRRTPSLSPPAGSPVGSPLSQPPSPAPFTPKGRPATKSKAASKQKGKTAAAADSGDSSTATRPLSGARMTAIGATCSGLFLQAVRLVNAFVGEDYGDVAKAAAIKGISTEVTLKLRLARKYTLTDETSNLESVEENLILSHEFVVLLDQYFGQPLDDTLVSLEPYLEKMSHLLHEPPRPMGSSSPAVVLNFAVDEAEGSLLGPDQGGQRRSSCGIGRQQITRKSCATIETGRACGKLCRASRRSCQEEHC